MELCWWEESVGPGGSGAESNVEVILRMGSIWFRRTGMFEGSGGWTGRGDSGDKVFV